MKKIVLFIMCIAVAFTLSACQTISGTINSNGIEHVISDQEKSLQDTADRQARTSLQELLKTLPATYNDTIVLQNENEYTFSAIIENSNMDNYVSFDLVEKQVDIDQLKYILMGQRAPEAIEKEDLSSAGKKYWGILDPLTNREIETLSYYTYGDVAANFFDYERDMLVYDDKHQTISIASNLPNISDDEAIEKTAEVLSLIGLSGMTVLDGYNYQTEVLIYFLPQFTSLSVVAEQSCIDVMSAKAIVCDHCVIKLSGASLFQEISDVRNVDNLLSFDGIMSVATEYLFETATAEQPGITEISLRHRYVYNEKVSANLVWYFDIPKQEIQAEEFGIMLQDYSFAIDAVDGRIYR